MLASVVGGAELVVQPIEAPLAGALAGKELDDGHAGKGFLQVGIEARQPVTDAAVVAPRLEAEEVHRHAEHRHQRQRHQGQAPVDGEHDGDDAEQRGDVHENRQGAGGEHFVDHVDVGGQPGHQATDRVAVEKARRQVLDMLDQIEAQVGEGSSAPPPSSARTAGRGGRTRPAWRVRRARRPAARRRGHPARCTDRSPP
jgi:hypothetical protein